MAKLNDWFEFMRESQLEDLTWDLLGEKKDEYIKLCNEFWKFESEDRDILLEDLKKNEGILYKKMCEWNENKLVIELGFNMVWWEYSLEDYFRDMFDKDNEYKDEFSLFSLEDINKMMYDGMDDM